MRLNRVSAAAAILLSTTALPSLAAAQDAAPQAAAASDSDDIIVTAQKREENLQNVPISVQVLGTRRLDQLGVTNFNQFTALLPSVSFQTSQPGQTTVYMRGVASGGDGNHSGSLPSVGVYLDEQPVTTIGGTLDVHIYDIARIESLAGPQGTLYGASSQAGTIRIITNKPDASAFDARIDTELNTVNSGGVGGQIEGMINIPLSPTIAFRAVGFYQHDAGYIDNVAGTRSFIGGISFNNAAFVEQDYNDLDVYGGRAALGIELDDNWTVTPSVLYQEMRSNGSFASDPRLGDLQVQRFGPEFRNDRFVQAALTIEGRISNWDITYAGAYLDRQVSQSNDYADYAEAYDQLYSSVGGVAGYFYFQNAAGNNINSRQQVLGSDHFRKFSQELRIASPSDARLRFVGGLFYQRQSNEIHQDYQVAGLSPLLSVNGHPGTLWLTEQDRVDRDYAAFGELSFDITPALTLTAGGRVFKYDNDLIGFFGFGRNPGNGFSDGPPNAAGSNRTGVAQCFTTAGQRLYNRDTDTYSTSRTLLPAAVRDGPCTNLATIVGGQLAPVQAEGDGFTHRLNLNWQASDGVLLYATWSRGFRPGGINRRADVAPYAADFLTNYELGWHTTLARGLRWNGAIYQQNWKSFQFSFLGPNSFTEIHNGPNARIRGIESDINYSGNGLTLNAAASYTDAVTTQNLCGYDDVTFTCRTPGPTGQINYVTSPTGTRLPITPQFKASASARYATAVGRGTVNFQAILTYQGSASSDLRTKVFIAALNDPNDAATVANPANFYNAAQAQGRLPAFASLGLSTGYDFGNWTFQAFVNNLFDERGQISRFQQCGSCTQRPYFVPVQPRTFGIRAGYHF